MRMRQWVCGAEGISRREETGTNLAKTYKNALKLRFADGLCHNNQS